MIVTEEEVIQIKKGKHKLYLWRPKPIVWNVKEGEDEQK